MTRFRTTLALPVLLAIAFACSDDGPTPPDGGIIPAEIQAQIDALFPSGNLRDSATDQVGDVLERADEGQAAEAQSLFLDFVDFGGAQAAAGTLLDPNGASPPTTESALATLADDVADEAGLSVPDLPAGAFTDDGAAVTLDGSGGTVVTPNGNAGIQLPAGALTGKVLITIEWIPETGDPADHDGPLPTSFPQYPRFYRIETFPAVTALAQAGVVGVCVVDPPDPFAPTPEVAARLRIAHPDPDDPQSIEILPLADAPFLDCGGSAASLSPASPGRLGGAISSFSPFAAVDPVGAPPSITSVTPNPISVGTTAGDFTDVMVGFADPDGDVDGIIGREVSDSNEVLQELFEIELTGLEGQTTGTLVFNFNCPSSAPDGCRSGQWVGDLSLVDRKGNESAPFRITVVFQ